MTSIPQSRRETRREERRGQFLQKARQLFLTRGYEATTIEDVSHLAGFSKRTVYLYFETKHELFCAVLQPELSELRDRLEHVVLPDDDGRAQLIAVAHEYVAFTQERPDVFSLLMHFETHDFYRGRDVARLRQHATACLAINEQISERVDSTIQRGLDDGSIESEQTPAQLNLMFWASAVGILQVCRQRATVLESHYGITESDLIDAFIHRMFSVRPNQGVSQ